jgi:glycosyltransferase involved in cell wall biosynthesis
VVKVGWLADHIGIIGGAEISDDAFLAAAPAQVEVVHCPPNKRPPDVDVFVVNNCVTYGACWLEALREKPVVRHIHDLWPHGSPRLRRWVLDMAQLLIFNSPKQEQTFQFPYTAPIAYVPPPVNVARFQEVGKAGHREGVLWLGRLSMGKGIHNVVDWSLRTGRRVDFYGPCYEPLARGHVVSPSHYCGVVSQDELPALLARYQTFIHLPVKGDICGRTTVESWASGLDLILGGDTEAFWQWVETADFQGAAETFWRHVLSAV